MLMDTYPDKTLKFIFLKRCPSCRGKLKKVEVREYTGKKYVYSCRVGKGFYEDSYKVEVKYQCKNCNQSFSIDDIKGRK